MIRNRGDVMNEQTILNFTESTVSVLITFILFFAIFMALLRVIIYLVRRPVSSSSNTRSEKSSKVPVAPKVTKSEIEESQLKRLAEEKEVVK